MSESENPALDSPSRSRVDPGRTRTGGRTSSTCRCSTSTRQRGNPLDEDFDYAEAFEDLDVEALKARPHRGDDHLAGLVARRLRPLRAAHDPAHLAPGRHLPHRGRPRRWRRRRPALRAAQQLARQRQPRQGPPPPVAGQAEVRPEGLLGRPARARRQRRPRVDGLQDLRVRLRPRGHLGARGDLLGPRGHVARRRALQRRARARRPVRRRADGPHLREPRGPERQRRPGQGRHRHPRDVPPHGHERRGDRRAHRRRPHLRQGPRRRRPRPGRSRARGLPRPRHGPRLDQRPRHRQGHRHHHQRARGRLEPHAHRVEQRLLGHALRLRVGARPQPGRRPAVAPEGRRRRRHRARRPGPEHAARADDGDHRPRAAHGPGVPEDLGAVPRQPRRSSPTPSPGPGTSCCTATWVRCPASSARGCPSRSCGRTRCRPSTTS